MADASGHRIARDQRELVEARLKGLFGPDVGPGEYGAAAGEVVGVVGARGVADEEAAEHEMSDYRVRARENDTDDDEIDPFAVGADREDDPDNNPDHDPDDYPSRGRRSARSRPRRTRGRSRVADPDRPAILARWSPSGRWRIDPERRGALAVITAIIVAGLAVGWQAMASRPHAEPVADPNGYSASYAGGSAATRVGPAATAPGAATSPAANLAPATAVTAKVIVDVVGRVHRPGLVTLPAGARVADAVRAAGGALTGTNLNSINLARVCVDGEQIAVGTTGAVAAPGPGTPGVVPGPRGPGGLVNLNTATAEQLDALPGVGPVMAQRIITYRTDHGPFSAVTQLQQVSGIGAAKYADLSPLVTV